MIRKLIILKIILITILVTSAKAKDCPDELPMKFGDFCYAAKFDLSTLDNAKDSCKDLYEGATLAVIHDQKVFEELINPVMDFVNSKIGKAYYWVGLRIEPPAKPGEKRDTDKQRWIVDFDDSRIIEEDYELWDTMPDTGLGCSVINGSKDFKTVAVDCGGPRLPVICQKFDDGNPCFHDQKPYFMYDDMCLAVISGSLEYKYVHASCSDEGKPASIINKKQKKLLERAVKNGFMGGAVFTGLAKDGDGKWTFPDGSEPADNEWEDNEPRDIYDCAGLSLQMDNTLKFRTTNCGNIATYVCSVQVKDEEDDKKDDDDNKGSGDGSGDGSDKGSGDGSGKGSGDGSGDGSGNGSGDGSGSGDGNGLYKLVSSQSSKKNTN